MWQLIEIHTKFYKNKFGNLWKLKEKYAEIYGNLWKIQENFQHTNILILLDNKQLIYISIEIQ